MSENKTEANRDTGVDMHLSPKNLLLALVLFAGGATGSSAITIARADAVPPALADDVKELKQELMRLTSSMAKIEGVLSQRSSDTARNEKRIDDHEERLRRLETRAGR